MDNREEGEDLKSPAFQFYPSEFLADENVVLMSNQEVGCYIKLLCYCWREGSIPADVPKIARLCGENGSAMADLWTAIKPCFVQAMADPSRLVHPRLEDERKKQEQYKSERAASGAKGAKVRWGKQLTLDEGDGSANGSANKELMANDGSLSLSSSSSSSSSNTPLPPTGEDGYSSAFLMFWQMYPRTRRMPKKAVFKCWQARLREKRPDRITEERLLTATANYAEECRIKGKDEEHILQPTTFLGPNERWLPFEEGLPATDEAIGGTRTYNEFD